MSDLSAKVALVTGASRGIGRSIAVALAKVLEPAMPALVIEVRSMGTKERVVARRLVEFASVLRDRHLIRVTVGPSLDMVLLSLDQKPDYRVLKGNASFPKRQAAIPTAVCRKAGRRRCWPETVPAPLRWPGSLSKCRRMPPTSL